MSVVIPQPPWHAFSQMIENHQLSTNMLNDHFLFFNMFSYA